MKKIILSLVILSFVWQLAAQTQISYHEHFIDKRMKWSEFEEDNKGFAELLPLGNREYIIGSEAEELIIGEYKLKLDARQDFTYKFNYENSESIFIGLSSNRVKLNFELDLIDGKYRIGYTKKGKYKVGSWKKLDEKLTNSSNEFYSVKIAKENNDFRFFYKDILVAGLAQNKFDQVEYFNKLEIGTSLELELTDVFIDGFVFLSPQQKFMDGEGITQDELAKKKFYSLSEIENNLQDDEFLKVYKLKIDNYDFAWDKDELPEAVFNCINLQQVEIDGRDKGDYAKIIGQLGDFQTLQVLELLIDSVPETVGELKNLRKLSAGNWTPISVAALEQICTLNKLKYLDLGTDEPYGYVPIEGLENIGSLTNLEYLDLSFSDFGKIPEGIYGLTNLKSLDIGGNNLGDLPDDFSKLKNLEYLYINDNFIGTIPSPVFTLSKLKYLDLTRNYLELLPEGISKLKKLEYLDLYGNDIPKKEIAKIKKVLAGLRINE